MSANEREGRDCGEKRQRDEDRLSTRMGSKSNVVQASITNRPAADDNSKAWPLIPFPDDWYAS